METLNRAIGDAAIFQDMLHKLQRAESPQPTSPEVQAWNAEVDRKKAEKMERRMQRAMQVERAAVQEHLGLKP